MLTRIIMKLHRYIDHDWQKTPIDSQGQDDKNSVTSAKRLFLLVTNNADNKRYKDRYDVKKDERKVVIVVGDGIAVLKTVHYAVTQYGIPVVVIPGSGSVADCIAKRHKHDSSDTYV
ncbi:hypothetical protein DPMN_095010 [Dreissena polymorpha]|uniref:TRPM SLOG domain-containing protein n=1 Tax=Dreissena polymorpha TaxID=45954 RepID=A0A9D4L5Q0_DREPO|nr:hypothetical protein DPMN_095010 [Dreissena polymorpha]